MPDRLPRTGQPNVGSEAQSSEITSLLGSMWNKYLPLMRERLAALDAAAQAAGRGTLVAADHALAVDAAHKFAGSLGMFGFPEGTDAARSLEHLLLEPPPYDATRFLRLVEQLHHILNL